MTSFFLALREVLVAKAGKALYSGNHRPLPEQIWVEKKGVGGYKPGS